MTAEVFISPVPYGEARGYGSRLALSDSASALSENLAGMTAEGLESAVPPPL
jgi:hypothetical protein